MFVLADKSTFGIESNVERLAVFLIKGYSDEHFVIDGFRHGFQHGVKRDFHLSCGKVKLRLSQLPLMSKLSDEVAHYW